MCEHKGIQSPKRMEKVFNLMDTNQNAPSNLYQIKIWYILPGQQSQCASIQLEIKADKELVQEGTFRYFWGNLAYTNKKNGRVASPVKPTVKNVAPHPR